MCIHHNCIGMETLDEREADTAESLEQPGYTSNTVHTTAIQSKSSLVCRQTHPQLSLLPLSTLPPAFIAPTFHTATNESYRHERALNCVSSSKQQHDQSPVWLSGSKRCLDTKPFGCITVYFLFNTQQTK